MSSGTATVIKHTDYPTGGCRRVYALSEPAQELVTGMLRKRPLRRRLVTCVCADFETTPDRGPETMVFACTESGAPFSFQSLATMGATTPATTRRCARSGSRCGMQVEFLCPVCRDGTLELNAPSWMGRSRYYVTCPSCGVSLDHHEFASYNGTLAFLRDHDAGEPEVDSVFNSAYDDARTWVCSGCGMRRALVADAPPFAFCPDCGKPVQP